VETERVIAKFAWYTAGTRTNALVGI
jgi:hypothetical protein